METPGGCKSGSNHQANRNRNMVYIIVGAFVAAAFVAGLLVGRKNPSIATAAAKVIADAKARGESAMEQAASDAAAKVLSQVSKFK
jgi:hypothetical protein